MKVQPAKEQIIDQLSARDAQDSNAVAQGVPRFGFAGVNAFRSKIELVLMMFALVIDSSSTVLFTVSTSLL